jgi:hypothetical protein
LWTGAVNNRYGAFNIGRNHMARSHRVAWTLTHGAIPDGASVLHRCDTPLCVNPSHLFLGTQADNLSDMAAKQRGRGKTTLTADDVRAIRARYANGEGVNALARAFGLSHPAISLIVHRKTWQWVHLT